MTAIPKGKIPEHAHVIALKAASFIAQDDDRLNRFMAITGFIPQNIKQDLKNPIVLAGFLDFLLDFEPDLIAFCNWAQEDPTTLLTLRSRLPGFSTMD